MKLKDLHDQVMVKKMISDQIIYVNLNAYVDVNSDPTWGRNIYLQSCIDTESCQELEQIHLTCSAHFSQNCGQL